MSEIAVSGLCKSYALPERTLQVLSGVTLRLSSGKITVLLGKSGCGKTTLLRILAGLEKPDAGEIVIPARQRVGVIFQEPRLMPWLSVEENILLADPGKKLMQERLRQLIRLVGLCGFEKAWPRQLSGGMQQRVALARALAYEPEWLLLDEPFSALDYFTRRTMQRELLRVQQTEQKGLFLVTHHLDEALYLADEILLLREGHISQRYILPERTRDQDPAEETLPHLKERILKELEREDEKKTVVPVLDGAVDNEHSRVRRIDRISGEADGNLCEIAAECAVHGGKREEHFR